MAWSTALGDEIDEVWKKLLAGKSGIKSQESLYPLRNDKVAAIKGPSILNRKEHLHQITKQTIEKAIQDAGLVGDSNVMLIVGTSFGARLDDEAVSLQPLHTWVDIIAEQLNLKSLALSTACSSASDAILTGAALIKAGFIDHCVCGGADILGESKRLAHSALGTMSPSTLKSFDEHREGTILGEGAGFIVLERATSGSNGYANLVGCGSANDAAGLTAPDEEGQGIHLAVNRSLEDAGLNVDDIKIINAHGSGTLTNDRIENRAYSELFQSNQPLVFATKGAFGHSLGATGALEAITLIQSLRHQVTPPICHMSKPLTSSNLLFSKYKTSIEAQYGLSLTIGFGGFNTSLIFQRGQR